MKLTILTLLFSITFVNLYSQNRSKEITTDKYKIILNWSDSLFLSGGMKIQDNADGKQLFSAENFHSGFNSEKTIDLNNDGSNEYILELTTGNTRSDYNMYVIFEFSKAPEPQCQVHNAELISNVDKNSDIVSNIRIGDPKMEAKYMFALNYNNGKLLLNKDIKGSKVLQELVPYEEDYSDLITEYAKSNNVCDENSQVKNYYEAYITQQKIVGNESKGIEFFDKNYKCDNKSSLESELKKSADDRYSKINNPETFNFNTTN